MTTRRAILLLGIWVGGPHIGVVVDKKSAKSGRYMIVDNIGQGPRMEDIMFNWKVTGHYHYFGPAL